MKKIKSILFFTLVLLISGCGTIYTLVDEPEKRNKIYSGTRLFFRSEWNFAHGFLDIPFSLVADTIMLPYTAPKTIYNFCSATPERKDAGKEPTEIEKDQ